MICGVHTSYSTQLKVECEVNSGIKASGFLDSDTNSSHVDYGTTLTFNCSTPGETVIVGTQVIRCEKST